MPGTILHADADAFFASVEQRDDPSLRRRPVAVGGGVVLAASYEARAFGVRGAMGGAQARRLCPALKVVPPRFTAYLEASRALFELFRDTAPDVEGISLEEAFLDVRGLEHISGTPERIAERLRWRVRNALGLALSVGVARTKSLAKLASQTAKPDGLLVVEPEGEREFLLPLPVERIWGVGPATAEKLHARGIRTVADLARLERREAMAVAGAAVGRHIHALALGDDPRRVRGGRRRSSIGSQSAIGRRLRTPAELDGVLVAIVDRVTRRLRAAGRAGGSVTLRLRFRDYKRATRSRRLTEPTAATERVLLVARELLADARPLLDERGCTLIGLTISDLEDNPAQLALPLDHDTRSLDATLDDLHARFGATAVVRGGAVGRDRGGTLADEAVGWRRGR